MALKLKGSTSGFVGLDAPAVAGNNTLILPENAGSAGQILANDITAGVTTFTSVTVNRNGDLTVPGTISIGGTLTYEDVTNVDSIGVITARTNIYLGDSIFHNGDANTRIRFPAVDTFTVETAGSERLRVTSNGLVGIGTDNPDTLLHLYGEGSTQKLLTFSSGPTKRNNYIGVAGADNLEIAVDEDNEGSGSTLRFRIDGGEKARITSGGLLCVGHDSSTGSGKIQASTAAQDGIDILGYNSTAANGGRLTFYRSKNATIGTNTEVADNDSLGRIDWRGYNDDGTAYNIGATIEAEVDGAVNSTTDMPSALLFKTSADGSSSPTERVRITSEGKMGLGTNDPNSEIHVSALGASDEPTIKISSENSSIFLRTAGSSGSFPTGGAGNDGELVYIGGSFRLGTGSASSNLIFFNGSGYTERVRIDSGGRMGVGLTPHTSDVATNVTEGLIQTDGNIDIRYSGTNSDPAGARYLNFINTDTTLVAGQPMGGLHWIGNDSDNANSITAAILADCTGNAGTHSSLLFKTGGTTRLEIEGTNGNVTIKDAKQLLFENDDQDASSAILNLGASGTSNLAFATGGSEKMRLDSTGRLLIGTTTAMSTGSNDIRDTIQGVATAGAQLLLGRNDSAVVSTNRLGEIAALGNDANGTYQVGASIRFEADANHGNDDKPTAIVFKTCSDGSATNSERMRITSSGNIVVNQVGGVNSRIAWGTITGVLYSGFSRYDGAAQDVGISHYATTNAGTSLVEHFRMEHNGTLKGTDTSIGSLSDIRLKKDVADYSYDISKFKQFKPKSFNWINPEVHGDKFNVKGFIAQDIEAVDGDWVEDSWIKASDPDFSLISDTTTTNGAGETVGISKISKFGYKDAMYISVIQQLIGRIETLETKVAALEG